MLDLSTNLLQDLGAHSPRVKSDRHLHTVDQGCEGRLLAAPNVTSCSRWHSCLGSIMYVNEL